MIIVLSRKLLEYLLATGNLKKIYKSAPPEIEINLHHCIQYTYNKL